MFPEVHWEACAEVLQIALHIGWRNCAHGRRHELNSIRRHALEPLRTGRDVSMQVSGQGPTRCEAGAGIHDINRTTFFYCGKAPNHTP